MIRTPWRRRDEPLDHAELARLLPAPGDPELSCDRLSGLEEHLMSEIRHLTPDASPGSRPPTSDAVPDVPFAGAREETRDLRPVRRSRRRPVLAGAGAALVLVAAGAAALAGGFGVPGGPGSAAAPPAGAVPAPVVQVAGQRRGAGGRGRRHLRGGGGRRAANRARGSSCTSGAEVSWMVTWDGPDGKNESYVEKLHPREVWMSPDGDKGWLVEPYKRPPAATASRWTTPVRSGRRSTRPATTTCEPCPPTRISC